MSVPKIGTSRAVIELDEEGRPLAMGDLVMRSEIHPAPPAIDRVADEADEADDHPAGADISRVDVQGQHRDPRGERANATYDRREGDLPAADADVARHPVGPLPVGLLDPHGDHGG